MALTRCEKGHYYDTDKYNSCPYCGDEELGAEISALREGHPEAEGESEDTDFEKTVRLGSPASAAFGGTREGETVAFMQASVGMDPVTGWLVCIEGPDKGRDFRLRSEKNALGRSASSDVCLSGDDTVSREKHAFVVYNPRKRSFSVRAGESRGLVYLNDEEVEFSQPLQAYDIVEVGQSRLLFVPLCGEAFSWD